jgi:hypothetical protein
MIAMQLTCPGFQQRQASGRSTNAIAQDDECSGILPADKPPCIDAPFQPLDPGVVSDAIPAFFIGRNKEGFWVARDANGQIGGIFLFEDSAVSFARKSSLPAGCVTIYPAERFELDLDNSGNPLVVQIGLLMCLARHPRQQLASLIGKMTEAVKRRLRGFDIR